ncbi:hypothetical protein DFJ63DRAFT_319379 [Scheffersomyces coipomensis]|uniref:uncharacterized protein n=1 Tax=Scheffersomyces coipomensis TaxID=1788519 RepID=UPI00315D780C
MSSLRKQTVPITNDKDKTSSTLNNSHDGNHQSIPQTHADPGLDTITERSKESSQVSLSVSNINVTDPSQPPTDDSNRPIAPEVSSWANSLSFSSFSAPRPNWLTWNTTPNGTVASDRRSTNSQTDEHNNSAILDSPEIPPQKDALPIPETENTVRADSVTETETNIEPWVDWSLQYRRVSSVVSYVYSRSTLNEEEAIPVSTGAVAGARGPSVVESSTSQIISEFNRKSSLSSPVRSSISLPKPPTIKSKTMSISPAGSLVSNQKKKTPSISPPPSQSIDHQNIIPSNGTTSQPSQVLSQPNEVTPLLSNVNENNTVDNSWFSWFTLPTFWSSAAADDSDDEEVHNSELYKSAKSAIENSKESSHYAIKCTNIDINSQEGGIRELELAVSDTMTEREPVKYRSRKRPLLPNEVQERTLINRTPTPPQPSQSQSSTQAVNQTPVVNTTIQNGTTSSSVSIQGAKSNGSEMITKDQQQAIAKVISRKSQVLPSIDKNLRTITLSTKVRLFLQDLMWKSSEKHIYRKKPRDIIKKRSQIKRVVVIGIHGFLPIKLVRTLIGQSTGNSIKYVSEASKCIRQWLEDKESCQVEINTIALEGEGKIEDRVQKLMILIENWISLLETSDFVFFVSHGQGTPVAINLLSRLLEAHPHISPSSLKKIGLLSMSGIINGPYKGLDSKLVIRAYTPFENEIIRELFEFQNPISQVSQNLINSLRNLVRRNVKITLSGSINDQFIPLYSSLGINFNHPNIFRDLFVIENNNDIPTFMIKFIKVLIIMKNMGINQDYKLIHHLSEKCMGTINNGGHCKIYGNDEIYTMAIKHSLETTSLIMNQDLYVENENMENLSLASVGMTPTNSDLKRTLGSSTSISSTTVATAAAVNTITTVTQPALNLYELSWNLRNLLQDLLSINNIGNVALIRELNDEIKSWDLYNPQYKIWKDLRPVFDIFGDIDIEELRL